MSSSQYTVHVAPEFQENGEQSVRRTLDVSELPKVLKIGLRCSARRNPKFATLTFFCAGGLGSFKCLRISQALLLLGLYWPS